MDMDTLHIRELLSEQVIRARVQELGALIHQSFLEEGQGRDLVLLGNLLGSSVFQADLARAIPARNLIMDCVGTQSYVVDSQQGNPDKHLASIRLTYEPVYDLHEKMVVIVEDILDTGRTLHFLLDYLREKYRVSPQVCCLLDKQARRDHTDLTADFVGFPIEDLFVVGYGLDYCSKLRNLPFIGVVEP